MRSESWFPGRRTPVASDQQQIDVIRQGQIHDALKNAPAALAVRGLLSGTTAAV